MGSSEVVDRLGGSLGVAVGRTFRLLQVAEEVLEEHGNPPGAFALLCPSEVLSGKSEWLYRAHITELVRRLLEGGDPREATDAEVLAGLMATGTKAPLNADATALVCELWQRLAPPDTPDVMDGWKPRARTEEGKERVLLDARRSLRQDQRFIKETEAA